MTHDDLLKLVDKATDTDRMFFERRRKRRFRVRRCHRAEIVQNALIEGKPPEVPPGMAWFAAVLNVCHGYRMRLFTLAPADTETDCTEREARETFELLATDYTWEVAERIAETVCREVAS